MNQVNYRFKGLYNLLFSYLCVNNNDAVLVCFESSRRNIIKELKLLVRKRNLNFAELKIDYDGVVIPETILEKMLDNTHNVIIFFLRNSIWHKRERWIAKHRLKKRLCSYSGTLKMLADGPCLAEPSKLKLICEDLKKHLKNVKSIIVTSEKTYLTAEVNGVFFEDGDYSKPGTGGNFPAGEISFGLKEESINGYLYSNIKVKHLGISKDNNRAIFKVKNDRIFIEPECKKFINLIDGYPELEYIGEISFGISPYKTIYNYRDSIQEEKILGTAHIGLGSNISFGGRREGRHLDVVFGPCSFTVDELSIIKNGKLNSRLLSDKTIKWLRDFNVLF
ncbi:hypothetical protein DRQ09_00405 [candidate division KSB1 bacterium]|nr:MAG: hypothetical protein DRQ09_00405 [candidate division KSB1 bacterium]